VPELDFLILRSGIPLKLLFQQRNSYTTYINIFIARIPWWEGNWARAQMRWLQQFSYEPKQAKCMNSADDDI
jgi:hypothetical protein